MSTETKAMTWIAQHTAGHALHGQTSVYDEASGKDIAIVYDGGAHADLISAAPELLAALEAFSVAAPFWGIPHPAERKIAQEVVDMARAAIAKAEGR